MTIFYFAQGQEFTAHRVGERYAAAPAVGFRVMEVHLVGERARGVVLKDAQVPYEEASVRLAAVAAAEEHLPHLPNGQSMQRHEHRPERHLPRQLGVRL